MVRRKGSTNVEFDDSDLHATWSIGNAGLVRPPVDIRQEGSGGMNLEQAISLLKAEREACMELQNQAFADTAALRVHLENEEQQCRGAAERIHQLDRWRAISELQAQQLNMRYQDDMREKGSVIAGLKERAVVRDQHLVLVEAECRGLQERLKHDESAVGQLRGSVASSEAASTELVERLNTH